MNLFKVIYVVLFHSVTTVSDVPTNYPAGTHDLALPESIKAIGDGAGLDINIQAMLPTESRTVLKAPTWVEGNIDKGCLQALLIPEKGAPVPITYTGHLFYTARGIELRLGNPAGIPEHRTFRAIELTTCMPLQQATLTWSNGSV